MIGQQFVPSPNSLDFKDLMLYGGGGTSTGSLAFRIHSGTMAAPAIAISLPVARSDGLESVTLLEFGPSVPLLHGHVNVAEVVELASDSAEWSVAGAGDGYDADRCFGEARLRLKAEIYGSARVS